MKLRILQTTQGSPDGIRLVTFKAGEELDGSDPRLTKLLARLFCEDGRAELVDDEDVVPIDDDELGDPDGDVVNEDDDETDETEEPDAPVVTEVEVVERPVRQTRRARTR